jgi:hypothetical protein
MYCGEMTSRNSQPAGHAGLVDAHQQVARNAQALVDAESCRSGTGSLISALPADRGARLLEIARASGSRGSVAVALSSLGQRFSHIRGRDRVMDRARSDDHQQPVGLAMQDLRSLRRVSVTSARTGVPWIGRSGSGARRRQRDDLVDALVVGQRCLVVDGGMWSWLVFASVTKKKPPGFSAGGFFWDPSG